MACLPRHEGLRLLNLHQHLPQQACARPLSFTDPFRPRAPPSSVPALLPQGSPRTSLMGPRPPPPRVPALLPHRSPCSSLIGPRAPPTLVSGSPPPLSPRAPLPWVPALFPHGSSCSSLMDPHAPPQRVPALLPHRLSQVRNCVGDRRGAVHSCLCSMLLRPPLTGVPRYPVLLQVPQGPHTEPLACGIPS